MARINDLLRMLPLLVGLAAVPVRANGQDYATWIAPSPQDQLDHEADDDRKGFGRIFIPAMSEGDWEPKAAIYDGSRIVMTEAPIGKSIFVEPGHYKVVFGNGVIPEQKLVKPVNVRDGETQVIEPDWAGLIVRIVNPTRKYLRQNYEVFGMQYEESFGINISKDENEPDEAPDTWILRPGLYKITKAGAPFNTYRNFATVLLLPGTLTQYTIVIDDEDETGLYNFIGAGVLPEFETQTVTRSNLSTYSALSVTFNLDSDDEELRGEFDTDVELNFDFDNRFQYDHAQHYFLSEPSYELELNNRLNAAEGTDGNLKLDVDTDELLLENIYIYYVISKIGVYGRLDARSHLFPKETKFSDPQTVYYSDDGTTVIDSEANLSSVIYSPSFSPTNFKESVGLDFTPVRGKKFRLSLRTGWGFWQYLNSRYKVPLKFDSGTYKDSVVYHRVDSDYLQGLELSMRTDYRPTSKLVWNTKLDMLFPNSSGDQTTYEFENLINLSLLKFVSMEYRLIFKRDSSHDYAWVRNNLGIKLTYIF